MTDTKKVKVKDPIKIITVKGKKLEKRLYPLKKDISLKKGKITKAPKEVWLTKEGAMFLKSKGYI